jgi:hypothetical protein
MVASQPESEKFPINRVCEVNAAETELGALHLRHMHQLTAEYDSRRALRAYHEIAIDAVATMYSYSTAAERLEGASKYPMLATKENCAVVAQAAIAATASAVRDGDKEQAQEIARHAVTYLVEASKYQQQRDFAVPQLVALWSAESLSITTRLGVLKGIADSMLVTQNWSKTQTESLAQDLRAYCHAKGGNDSFALVIENSPLLREITVWHDVVSFSEYVGSIIEGKAQLPMPIPPLS